MALTAEETFGGVVPGFVTDLEGNLATAASGTNLSVVHGFLTDDDGRLVVTTDDTDATFQGGFLRSPEGALVTATSGSETGVVPGFTTNEAGALVTASGGSTSWQGGFLRTDTGALGVAGGAAPDPGDFPYTESFDTDTGEWFVSSDDPGAALTRVTSPFQSSPASLQVSFNDNYPSVTAGRVMPGAAGTYSLELYVRNSATTPVDEVTVGLYGLDGDSEVVDSLPEELAQILVSGWTPVEISGELVGAGIEQIMIAVTKGSVTMDVTDSFYIDTVTLEKTA